MKTSAGLFFTDILPHKRNLYSKVIKNKIFTEGVHPKDIFKTLKESGVEGIEIFLPSYTKITLEDILEIKEELDTHNMPVFSLHQPLRFFSKTQIAEISLLFHMAQLLGAEVIVLHIANAGKEIFDKIYIDAIHDLQKKYGIQVGFENRERYLPSVRQKYTWDGETFGKLMEKNDFQITLDTTHLAQAGGDILTFFKKYKDRIVNIHLSDYKDNMWNTSLRPFRFKHLPLGHGELSIVDFLKLLKQEKYKGLVTMEIHTDLPGMCASAQLITKHSK